MSIMTLCVLVAILSCGCGVGLGFCCGVNLALWHERKRAAETPPRPLRISFHEHFPEGCGELNDCEPDGGDQDDDDAYESRLGPRDN